MKLTVLKNSIISILGFGYSFIKICFVSFFYLSFFFVILFRYVSVPLTPTMLIQSIERKSLVRQTWVPYEDISSSMPLALVANEDQQFPYHKGFDWKGIEAAYEENQEGRRFRGGSTISQQTAKNVFLWQGKSYLRKGIEVYFTFLIESFWSKKRILEVYMNVAETGPGIFGVEEASQYYFKKPASKLSQGEAAQIAGMFPNPRYWNIRNTTRKNRILQQMRNLGSGYLKGL
jgi:monofunctional glycosyltransferase